jgi:hypothetical protein
MKNRMLLRLLSHPANRGKHLICVGEKVFTARTGDQALKILNRVHEKYPKKKVTLAYAPKADALILFA